MAKRTKFHWDHRRDYHHGVVHIAQVVFYAGGIDADQCDAAGVAFTGNDGGHANTSGPGRDGVVFQCDRSVISDVISAVHANDSDSGGNARVSYELLNENVHFIIGERSGVIRLRENHPFEQVGLGSVRFIYIDIDMNN